MTSIDLTARALPYSLYLPSVQPHSACRIVGEDDAMRDGKTPKGLKPSDFNFLNPNNPYWHYRWCLATAGHFKDERKPNAITHRNTGAFILGDSGGFQIGKGTLPEVKGWKKHRNSPKKIMKLWRECDVKRDIVNWVDANCDRAMTIDIPTWCLGDEKSPFCNLNINQFTELSVENLRFISDHRGVYGNCKFLNVLQGKSEEQEEHWYQAVKGFQFEGWSFADHVGRKGGIYRILRRALLLRDEKLLESPYDWLHILMLSKVRMTPLMTALQNAVRATVNENFTVSYDSSSPYQTSGKGAKYAALTGFGPAFKNSWTISSKKFPTGYDFANLAGRMPLKKAHKEYLPVPLDSPIASLLSVQDINFKKGDMAPSTFDAFSDEVLINHNVYTYVLGNILANEAAFGKTPTAPQEMMDAIGIIGELFRVESWADLLEEKRYVLTKIAG